jgi:cobalt-zinc-cadmium efflux system protein
MSEDVHHDHSHHQAGPQRRLVLALVLTATFMLVEALAGLWTGSLALLADAGHMLTDVAALSLTLMALRIARRPADQRYGYGYGRFSPLSSYTNGVSIMLLALWIAVEAIQRLGNPVEIIGGGMLAVASIGLGINLLCLWLLKGHGHGHAHGHHHDHDHEHQVGGMALSGAALHVFGDLLGSVAAIAASLVVVFTGWTLIDPILSLIVVVILVLGAIQTIRRSAHLLLEATPTGVDLPALQRELEAHPAVLTIHNLHVWQVDEETRAATVHVVSEGDKNAALEAATGILEACGAEHVTVQVEGLHFHDRDNAHEH